MAAGGAFPPPLYSLDEEGEAYVVKVVGWLMDPKKRRRIFDSGGQDPSYEKPWQILEELYPSEEFSAILGGARDSVILDPVKVADLVRACLIQGGIEQEEAELALLAHGRREIDGVPAHSSMGAAAARSGSAVAGEGELSKRIKIEKLGRLGHGEYSPSSQSSDVVGSMGSESPVDALMNVGGRVNRSNLEKVNNRYVKVCPPPVCKNVSTSGTLPHVERGHNSTDGTRSGAKIEMEKQDAEEEEDLVDLGSKDNEVEAILSPVIGLVETCGSARSDPLLLVTHVEPLADCDPSSAPLGSEELGCIQPVCANASLEDAALAQEFQPPAPGVDLQDWVRVAKDSRKGRKSSAVSGKIPAVIGAPSALDQASTDPFPPLSAGVEIIADACGDGQRGFSKGGPPITEANQKEVNNFSWKELLRTNKPVDLGVDLHFVEPTMIDGEPCAVFSAEEEAENLAIWQHTLICYVVGKSPTYFQFLKAVTRLWKPPGGVEVFMRENGLFYCRFSCTDDMNRVIKNGPWYMEGKLVVVKKFVGATNCEETMLSSIPIWVKLPCLPVQWWSISGVSKVVSVIGHPLYFDVPSASQSRIAYARCCVEVAMDRELPSWVTCIGSDKVRRKQKIEYDWVPKKCSKCKIFGHLAADCTSMTNKDVTKMVEEQGKYKGVELNSKFSMGKQPIEWENPKGIKNRIDRGGLEKQSKWKLGRQSPRNKVIMLNNTCGGSFQPLLNIEEEVPDEVRDVDLNGESLGIHLEGDVPVVQNIREGEAEANIEDEGGGKEQVAETNKEDTHGMVDKKGVSFTTRWEGDSEENDSGNQGEDDSAIMEDSDYTKSNKKKKRIRKKPAPTRPEGSRTTRHSGNIPKMNE